MHAGGAQHRGANHFGRRSGALTNHSLEVYVERWGHGWSSAEQNLGEWGQIGKSHIFFGDAAGNFCGSNMVSLEHSLKQSFHEDFYEGSSSALAASSSRHVVSGNF